MKSILRELIKRGSENPPCDCRDILEYVYSFLKQNTKARVYYQNVTATKGNIIALFGKPTLLVHAHLDTVPATQTWTQNPFQLVRKNKKLYGLGTTDVKGAIAAILNAAAKQPPRNLMLLFDSDEENISNECMKAFLASRFCRGISHAMVNEPTKLNIVTAHKGIRIVRFMFHGKAAHASRPEQGANAIEQAAEFVIALKKYNKKIARRTYRSLTKPTLSIGRITGGTKANIVPARCEIEVDRRVLPGGDETRADRELRALVRNYPGHVTMKTVYVAPSFSTSIRFPYVSLMKQCGARTNSASVDFWTEAALLSAGGIDCVVCGPGSISQAHTADEYITEHAFKQAKNYYRQLFSQL